MRQAEIALVTNAIWHESCIQSGTVRRGRSANVKGYRGARLHRLFIVVCSVTFLATVPVDRSGAASQPILSSSRAIVSVGLQEQMRSLATSVQGRRVVRSVPSLSLIVSATRDVSAAIRRDGGNVRADVRGRIMTAVLPVSAIEDLARQPGVVSLHPDERLSP
jgi:hypothetical protein